MTSTDSTHTEPSPQEIMKNTISRRLEPNITTNRGDNSDVETYRPSSAILERLEHGVPSLKIKSTGFYQSIDNLSDSIQPELLFFDETITTNSRYLETFIDKDRLDRRVWRI